MGDHKNSWKKKLNKIAPPPYGMPTAVDPAKRDAKRAGTELTMLDFELGRSEYTNDHIQGNDIRDSRLICKVRRVESQTTESRITGGD